MKRILYLLFGFGLGQGSMFLAQTYLIYNHKFEIASKSAIGLGFLSLTYWAVEMGGIFTFNKAYQKSPAEIINYFTARFLIGLGIAALSIASLNLLKIDDQLLLGIVSITPAIAIATTASLLGYIDATQKNHKTSHLSGLPWITASAFLLLPEQLTNPHQHGIAIGLAFLAGQLIFTLSQHICMRQELKLLDLQAIKKDKVIAYTKDGLAYNLSFSSSQIYGRTTPLIIDAVIGAKISSLYIYTRNITNMFSQISIFAKRIEFPHLSNLKNKKFTSLLQLQKISSTITTLFFLSTLIFVGTSKLINNSPSLLQEISSILSLQMLIYLLFNIAGLYSQPLTARGMIMENAKIQAFQNIICLALAYPALKLAGLNLMLLSEACLMAVGIALYSRRLSTALNKTARPL